MSPVSVRFNPGIDEITSRLRSLPIEYQKEVLDEAQKYAIDVLATYPPQKSVTRKKAYGVSFFSDRQRRWFFA
jgi:hypothetical protein